MRHYLIEIECKFRWFSCMPIVYAYNAIRALRDAVIPVSDGRTLHVPAGTEILVNCHGLNTDPAVWGPDAQEWRPQRWSEPPPKVEIPGIYAHS